MTTTQQPGPSSLPTADGTAELIGYGRVDWPKLTVMLAGSQTAWADYDGFHIGPLPAAVPPYTHLWAWTRRWLARARIEGDAAIIGVLAFDGEPQSAPPAQLRETVNFKHARATTWPADEKRVAKQADHVADRPVDVYLIPGEQPITFVAGD
jgi:hypothetical protein